MKIGLGVSEDLHVREQQAIATKVQAAGLASLWTNEARGRDALLLCQAWAAATTTLEVGVAVLPIWTRSPAQIAMAAATLQEASDGRFLLGLGVSHPATMGPWHHADFRRPRTAARETLAVLRQLFAGEKSDVEGDVTGSRHFRLGLRPLPAPPRVLLGAMGPRMLTTAGSDADGAFLNWSGVEEVGRAQAAVREAATGECTVATYVRVAVDPDPAAARDALAREFGQYAALPAYADHFGRQGLGDTVAAVKAAFRQDGPDAVPSAITDEALRVVGWWGTPEDSPRTAFGAFADAGLDHLVARVVVVGSDPAASIGHAMEAIARA